MKKINYILILLTGLLIFACSSEKKSTELVISGQFYNSKCTKIYFRELGVDAIKTLDSVTPDQKGNFVFRCSSSEAGFYMLKTTSEEYILLLAEKGENIHVDADFKKSPFTYSVAGSPGSALLKEFYDYTLMNLSKVDSLRKILVKKQNTAEYYPLSLHFDTVFRQLIDDQRKFERDFIIRYPSSLSSLIVLNYNFGRYAVLNSSVDFDLYLKLDSALSKIYPANKHVVFHHQRVSEHQREETVKQLEQKRKNGK